MPNLFLDDQIGVISPNSFCVLAYICRRTLGFNRLSTTIPLNQFLTGTIGADGTKLDNGTGITNKRTLIACLAELREKGLISYTSTRGQVTEYSVILPAASSDLPLDDEKASGNSATRQVAELPLATPKKSLSKRDKLILRKKVLEKKKDTRSISAPIDFSKFEPGGKYHKLTLPK